MIVSTSAYRKRLGTNIFDPISILLNSVSDHYRPDRITVGSITVRYRSKQNDGWDQTFPSGDITFIHVHRRINVDATSRRYIDVYRKIINVMSPVFIWTQLCVILWCTIALFARRGQLLVSFEVDNHTGKSFFEDGLKYYVCIIHNHLYRTIYS